MNPTVEAAFRGRARARHLEFVRYCWRDATVPFVVGRHTRAICSAIDRVFKRLRAGASTFIAFQCPFRHGKSEMVSRYLPPHFFGEFPDLELILCTYAAGLTYSFSRAGRAIMSGEQFGRLYPGVGLAYGDGSIKSWAIEGHVGRAAFAGLGGDIVGKGMSLGIVDDFFADRSEAESKKVRNTRWEAFTDSFMTRRAPTSAVFVLATPWHVDDLFGRIKEKSAVDAGFPAFEFMRYPAIDDDGSLGYESGTLFPERFPPEWYETQRATLGEYAAAGLLQCAPMPRGGGMLKTDTVEVVDEMPSGLRWVRAWDLASSQEQRTGSDPDYTVGAKVAVSRAATAVAGLYVLTLYVADVVRGRWEGLKRDEIIRGTAIRDGAIPVVIEGYGGYKDAYTSLRDTLAGIRSVRRANLPGDKVAKASPLEPVFEAGNVYLQRGAWTEAYKAEMREFPSATHDDQVDATAVGFDLAKRLVGDMGARVAL